MIVATPMYNNHVKAENDIKHSHHSHNTPKVETLK